jgi:hypothetical protein
LFRCWSVLTSFDLFYLGNIKSFKMYARNFTRNRKKTTQSGEKTKTFGWCLDMHWISKWVGVDRKVGDKFWGWTRFQNWSAKKIWNDVKKKMSFGWIFYGSILQTQLFKFWQRWGRGRGTYHFAFIMSSAKIIKHFLTIMCCIEQGT